MFPIGIVAHTNEQRAWKLEEMIYHTELCGRSRLSWKFRLACVFQDWLTSLEDYFEWYDMSADRKVRFVRMKLKGQAQVWWQSVEEQLHYTH